MNYRAAYSSPLGEITLASDDGESLRGLWIEGQKYHGGTVSLNTAGKDNFSAPDKGGLPALDKNGLPVFDKDGLPVFDGLPIFNKTKNWLDRYFAGENPPISLLPLAPSGGGFRQGVWEILCDIPYGGVVTYGDIAKKMAEKSGKAKMSAQAVGGAVGHNPISIIIPCHRVVGRGGSLTGYGGGLKTKLWLLKHEGADTSRLFFPKKGTAL